LGSQHGDLGDLCLKKLNKTIVFHNNLGQKEGKNGGQNLSAPFLWSKKPQKQETNYIEIVKP
jgi:hypothetical protein